MTTFYIYLFSTALILLVLIHAVYSIVVNNRRSLSSSGAIVKNVLRPTEKHSFTLKHVRREVLKRQITGTLEITTGFAALLFVITLIIISYAKFI